MHCIFGGLVVSNNFTAFSAFLLMPQHSFIALSSYREGGVGPFAVLGRRHAVRFLPLAKKQFVK
jgi:hypothetical protein